MENHLKTYKDEVKEPSDIDPNHAVNVSDNTLKKAEVDLLKGHQVRQNSSFKIHNKFVEDATKELTKA